MANRICSKVYFLLFSLCLAEASSPSLKFKEHIRDATKLECSDVLYLPEKPSPDSNLFVVQFGSSQFTYKSLDKENLRKIFPDIFQKHYVLAFDMPGVSTDLNKSKIPGHPTWMTRVQEIKDGKNITVYLLNDFFRAKNSDFSNCMIQSIKDTFSEIGPRKIRLFGYSMGGEVMSHFMTETLKKAPDLFFAVKSLFLGAPFLDLPKDNLRKQIETLTLLRKDVKIELKVTEEDPETGKKLEHLETKTGFGVTFENVWHDILHLDHSIFIKGYYPPANKFYFNDSDLSFVYLKSVQESGGGGHDLQVLMNKKMLPPTFIYQGVADWHTSSDLVVKLLKKSKIKKTPLEVRFYDAIHDLFAKPEFFLQIHGDIASSIEKL